MLRNYRDLEVWQKSYALALDVYRLTSEFPKREVYGMVSQLTRAAVSIPSNIAEGYSRGHTADYVRFLYIARGSLAEIDTQLMLSRDLGYIEAEVCLRILKRYEHLERMLSALIRGLKEKQDRQGLGA